jgi:hypothetical protein
MVCSMSVRNNLGKVDRDGKGDEKLRINIWLVAHARDKNLSYLVVMRDIFY